MTHYHSCSCGRQYERQLAGPDAWLDCSCGIRQGIHSVERIRMAEEAHQRHWRDTMAGHRNVMRIGAELIKARKA